MLWYSFGARGQQMRFDTMLCVNPGAKYIGGAWRPDAVAPHRSAHLAVTSGFCTT